MFIQIHMLQSMPPGNLNRDETGQPKKCIFGGVTRGRISSQCLKRNIRRSPEFKAAFGDALSDRTTYLPRIVADALRKLKLGVPDEELDPLMTALAARFKKEKRGQTDDGAEGEVETTPDGASTGAGTNGQTGQLVFFPPPFAESIANLVAKLRNDNHQAYSSFIGNVKGKLSKEEKKTADADINKLICGIATASKQLTVDIGLFGRMTTSDLVVNVEAACQVAHAISTHEAIIESDYFTAMDDRKADYVQSQTDKAGAAFMGSGETETFFDSAVYYKYLNVDLDALKEHLPSLGDEGAAKVAGTLVSATALANPTGKQNSFASHGIPELILVELSHVKRPISYANAFLQPVEGPNYLARSADALKSYVEAVAPAFAPADMQRYLLAVGHAKTSIQCATPVETLDKLVETVGRASIETGAEART